MKKLVILAAAGVVLASAVAYAQMQHGPGMQQRQGMHGQGMHGQGMHGKSMHGGHSGHGTGDAKGDQGPASLAFQGINAKMHKGMDIAFTGNTDVDFVKGMIPHHEGAVDMAKTVLGRSARTRRCAHSPTRSSNRRKPRSRR